MEDLVSNRQNGPVDPVTSPTVLRSTLVPPGGATWVGPARTRAPGTCSSPRPYPSASGRSPLMDEVDRGVEAEPRARASVPIGAPPIGSDRHPVQPTDA